MTQIEYSNSTAPKEGGESMDVQGLRDFFETSAKAQVEEQAKTIHKLILDNKALRARVTVMESRCAAVMGKWACPFCGYKKDCSVFNKSKQG